MAILHGSGGKVDFGGEISFVTDWTITTSADIERSTDMGDSFELYEPLLDDVTITVEGYAATERDTIGQMSTTAAEIKCYIDDTHYFNCDVFCTSITEVANVNSIGKITYNFEMSDVDGLQYS